MKNFKSFYLAKGLLMIAMLSSTIQAQANYEDDMNKQPYHNVAEKKIELTSSTSTNMTFKVSTSTFKTFALVIVITIMLTLMLFSEFKNNKIKNVCNMVIAYFMGQDPNLTLSFIAWNMIPIVWAYIFLPLAFLGLLKLMLWMYLPEENTNNRYTNRKE